MKSISMSIELRIRLHNVVAAPGPLASHKSISGAFAAPVFFALAPSFLPALITAQCLATQLWSSLCGSFYAGLLCSPALIFLFASATLRLFNFDVKRAGRLVRRSTEWPALRRPYAVPVWVAPHAGPQRTLRQVETIQALLTCVCPAGGLRFVSLGRLDSFLIESKILTAAFALQSAK